MQKSILKSNVPLLLAFLALLLIFSVDSKAATDSEATTTQSTFPKVQAADESQFKPHLGVQAGYAEPGDNHDGAAQYGVEFGYQPIIPIGVALEASTFLTDRDNEDNLRRTTLIGKATYNFGGNTPVIKHSFVGLGIGGVLDTEGEDETNLGVKYLAGVDFPLTGSGMVRSKSFTLGATASYLTVVNAQDTFALNGQLKYWF
ncbi:MAG: hypothetical protein V4596_14530 [Bdellovibrionota bacterium]